MKKRQWIIFFLVLCVWAVWGQDTQSLLKTYKRNFAIASLDIKIQILKDAEKSASKEMGSLYLQAVDYILDNPTLIKSDTRFQELAIIAVKQIHKSNYKDGAYSIWKLFETGKETILREAIMNALGVVAEGDAAVIKEMYLWLDSQNNIFKTGTIPDQRVISACIRSLGQLGDPLAFPIIFSSMTLGYTKEVTDQAKTTLLQIEGDLKDHLYGVIKSSQFSEKKQALIMAVENEQLDDNKKGEIAEFSLDVGLHSGTTDTLEQKITRDIRFISIRALSERKWSKATALVIEHFNSTVLEFDRGITDKIYLLEAISCLGNMGSHEAAVRLTQYLVLLNSYTEKLQTYDAEIVTAVVENLGKLGDKASFDDLMYTQYLSYTAKIKKAAQKALENLKW